MTSSVKTTCIAVVLSMCPY